MSVFNEFFYYACNVVSWGFLFLSFKKMRYGHEFEAIYYVLVAICIGWF